MPRPRREDREARQARMREQHAQRILAMRAGPTEARRHGLRDAAAQLPQHPQHPLRQTPAHEPAMAPAVAQGRDLTPLLEDVDAHDALPDTNDKFSGPNTKPMLGVMNDQGLWKRVHVLYDLEGGKTMVMDSVAVEDLRLVPKTMNQVDKTPWVKSTLGRLELIGTVDVVVCLDGKAPTVLTDCLLVHSKSKAPRIAMYIGLEDTMKIGNVRQSLAPELSQTPIPTQAQSGIPEATAAPTRARIPAPAPTPSPAYPGPTYTGYAAAGAGYEGPYFNGNAFMHPPESQFLQPDWAALIPPGHFGGMSMATQPYNPNPSIPSAANQGGGGTGGGGGAAGVQNLSTLSPGQDFLFNYDNNVLDENNANPWQNPQPPNQ